MSFSTLNFEDLSLLMDLRKNFFYSQRYILDTNNFSNLPDNRRNKENSRWKFRFTHYKS